jgi:hypothetical protein
LKTKEETFGRGNCPRRLHERVRSPVRNPQRPSAGMENFLGPKYGGLLSQ